MEVVKLAGTSVRLGTMGSVLRMRCLSMCYVSSYAGLYTGEARNHGDSAKDEMFINVLCKILCSPGNSVQIKL